MNIIQIILFLLLTKLLFHQTIQLELIITPKILIFFYSEKKYYDIYGKKTEQNLINNINKGHNELEKYFKSIINNSNYKMDILLTKREIKGNLENIIIWEQTCFKYKYYFHKIKDILIQIHKKDKEMKEIHILIDEPNNNKYKYNENINYENNEYQKLQLINKQTIIQAQELALLNDNFGRALASSECFANRCSEKEISNTFNYYDMFNLGKTQDLNE